MDVKEKLVELLTEFYGCDPMYYDVDTLAIADHLIANGATVHKWILVGDELPKYTGEYNVTVGVPSEFGYFETVTTLRFEILKGKEPRWVMPHNEIYRVIAWMPLPTKYQPPEIKWGK